MRELAADPDIHRFYTVLYREADRLTGSAHGRTEFVRTQELLRKLLTKPPATVLDVGGGPGAHARWLAADGYTVHLIDLVVSHVQAARGSGAVMSGSVGDARLLPIRTATADATLLLGPLYHLTDRADRVSALREAARATRPGGVVAAAAISRNGPFIDLTKEGRLGPSTLPRLLATYASGVNDTAIGFTTAYYHRPEELRGEFSAAGLPDPQVFGIEGPLWPLLDKLDAGPADALFRDAMICARVFETDPAVIGTSAHLLAAATRP